MHCSMSTMHPSPSSSSSSNLNPSIITISLILIITTIATVSLILIIRRLAGCLKNCHRQTHSSTNSSISSQYRNVSPLILIDSLPLFSFSSVISSRDGDCAVCLSKFQTHDQLRLLPLCCHAFHAQCVDSWLQSNLTCPLCRSNVTVSTSDLTDRSRGSFRFEIGSVSQRRSESDSYDQRRSYSMGSFDYVVEGESEVSVSNGYGRSDEKVVLPLTPPEERLAADVAEGRSWVSECMDRVAATLSSRTLSFRSSGRFFTGSSRRSNVEELNLEAGSIGDEISELFRWAAGV